ncbi:uncharacterized protein [Brachyistius frenatus]|uniref:uncharacterized protein n=1 Tax=Brachyistius frenatus TaxID=100188 RepID=UPI0037E98E98
MEKSEENPLFEPESNQDTTPGQKMTSDPAKTPSEQKLKPRPGIAKINPKPKPVQEPEFKSETATFTPKPNQNPPNESMEKSEENPLFEPESNQDSTPGQKITPNRAKTPPDLKPKPRPGIPKINQKPKPVQEPESKSETTTFAPKPNQNPPNESMENSEENPSLQPESDQDSSPGRKITPDRAKTPPDLKPKPRPGIPKINQKPKPVQEPESKSETTTFAPKPNQIPPNKSPENSEENPLFEPESNQNSTPGQKITPSRAKVPPDQRPKPRPVIPKNDKKPKPGQMPKPNQKHPKPVTHLKAKPNVNPKTGKAPQTNQNLKTPRPGQTPNLNTKSVLDNVPQAKSNKTSKPRPPSRYRPPSRPTVKPGATPVQRPKPAVQPKPNPKTETHLDPAQISWTTSEDVQHSQTDMAPTSGLVKQIAEVTHSPRDIGFSTSVRKTITLSPKTSNSLETTPSPHRHTEDFTVSPNSGVMSDPRPQTASPPPSIPMTTRPNKSISGILPSTRPGSTKPNLIPKSDSSLQAKTFHNVEDTAPAAPSPSSQITSTLSRDFRSTTPATSGPEPPAAESSTPSARELRVKINQVSAFLNNSPSANGRPPYRHPKEQPEDTRGGSRPDRPDSKLPITSKVATAKRGCADYLLAGQTKSGVYLVTPDLRSRSFPVFCDMEHQGGGWTVLQRRQDGSVSFNRTWAQYQSGFGELNGGEFWLGNDMIHLLTRDRDMVLRVDLEDFDGLAEYAQYDLFRVASERLRYRLTVGGYSGTAGDALRFSKSYDHNNKAFTTPDRDHDRYPSGNCGAYYSSGWWFDACMASNLNGRYYVGRYKGVRDGIYWGTWHNISTEYYPTNERQSFKTVRMMIRPKGFAP